MSDKPINISVVVDFAGVKNADKVVAEVNKSLKKITGNLSNGVLKFGVDQQSVNKLEETLNKANVNLINTLVEFIQAFKRVQDAVDSNIEIEVRDGDIEKFKKAIQQVFNEVLSKIRKDISELSSVASKTTKAVAQGSKAASGPVATKKTKSQAEDSGDVLFNVADTVLAQNLAKTEQERFRNLKVFLSNLRKTEEDFRNQISQALGTQVTFSRNIFLEELSKSEIKNVRDQAAELARNSLAIQEELIASKARYNVALEQEGENISEATRDEAVLIDQYEQLLGVAGDLTLALEKRGRVFRSNIELSQKQRKFDSDYANVLSNTTRLQERYNKEFDAARAAGDTGTILSIAKQFEKVGQSITNVLKLGEQLKARLGEQIAQVDSETQQLNIELIQLEQKLEGVTDAAEKTNILEGVDRIKQQIDALNLERQAIVANRKEQQDLIETIQNADRSSKARQQDIRSAARVLNEQNAINERTIKSVNRLKFATESASLAFASFSKTSSNNGSSRSVAIIEPSRVIAASNAIKELVAAQSELERKQRDLILVKDIELAQLQEEFNSRTGRFEGVESEQQLVSILKKATQDISATYNQRIDDLKEYQDVLSKIQSDNVFAEAKSVVETDKAYKDLSKSVKDTGEKVSQLVVKGKLLAGLDLSKPTVDLKEIKKAADSVDSEISRLTNKSLELVAALSVTDDGQGIKVIKDQMGGLIAELDRLSALKQEISGKGAFSEEIGFRLDVLNKSEKNLKDYEQTYRQILSQLKSAQNALGSPDTSISASGAQEILQIGKTSEAASTKINRLVFDLESLQNTTLGLTQSDKVLLTSLKELQSGFQALGISVAEEESGLKRIAASIQNIDDRNSIIDNTINKQQKLRVSTIDTAIAFRNLGEISKQYRGNIISGMFDPSVIIKSKDATQALEKAQSNLEQQARDLYVAYKLQQEVLRDNLENKSGQFQGDKSEAERLAIFKRITDEYEQLYNQRILDIDRYRQALAGITDTEGFKYAKSINEADSNFKKLTKSVQETTDKVNNLNVRAIQLANLDISDPTLDIIELKKVADNTEAEIFKLTQSAKQLQVALQLTDGGNGARQIQEQIAAISAEIARLINIKNAIAGNGAFSDDLGIRADLLKKSLANVQDYSKKYVEAVRSRDNAVAAINNRDPEVQLSGVQDLLRLISESKRYETQVRRNIIEIEQLAASGKKLTQQEQEQLATLRQLAGGFGAFNRELAQEQLQLQGVEKNLKRTKKAFELYNQEVAQQIRQQLKFVNAMTIVGTVLFGLRSAFSAILEESRVFSRTLTVIQSTGQSLAATYKQVREEVKQAAIDFGVRVEEAAEIVKQFGSAGFSAEEALAALVPSLKLVISTQANAEQAARTLAGLYRVFGQELKKTGDDVAAFARLNDVLISVYRNHQVELEELVQGFKFAAGAAKLSGFSFEETAALLAVLNDNMIKSGTAGRGLQVVLAQVGKRSKEISEAFGFELDASKPLADQFIPLLETVNEKLATGEKSIKDIDNLFSQFGLRGARSFVVLAEQVDDLKDTFDELKNRSEGVGDALAEIVRGELANQFEGAKQALIDIAKLGLDPFKDAVIGLADFVKGLRELYVASGKLGKGISVLLFGGGGFLVFAQSLLAVTQVSLTMASAVKTSVVALLEFTGISRAAAVSTQQLTIAQLEAAAAGNAQATANAGVSASVSRLAGAGSASALGGALLLVAGLAAAFVYLRTTTQDLRRELEQLSGKAFEDSQTIQRAEQFEKRLVKIQEITDKETRTMKTLGSIIKASMEEAGSSVVSQADVANRSLEDIGKNARSIIQQTRQSASLAKAIALKDQEDLKVAQIKNLKEQIRETENVFRSQSQGFFTPSFSKYNLDLFNPFSGQANKLGQELGQNFNSIKGEDTSTVDFFSRATASAYQIFTEDTLDDRFKAYKDLSTKVAALAENDTSENALQLRKQQQDAEASYDKRVKSFIKTVEEIDKVKGNVNESLSIALGELDVNTAQSTIDDLRSRFFALIEQTSSASKLAVLDLQDTLEPTTGNLESFVKALKAPVSSNVFNSATKDLVRLRRESDIAQKELTTRNFAAGFSPSTSQSLTKDLVKGVFSTNLKTFDDNQQKQKVAALAKSLGVSFDEEFKKSGIDSVLNESIGRVFTKDNIVNADALASAVSRFANATNDAGIKSQFAETQFNKLLANAVTIDKLRQTAEVFKTLASDITKAVAITRSFNPNVSLAGSIRARRQILKAEELNGVNRESLEKRLGELYNEQIEKLIKVNELKEEQGLPGDDPQVEDLQQQADRLGKTYEETRDKLVQHVEFVADINKDQKQLNFNIIQQGVNINNATKKLLAYRAGLRGAYVDAKLTADQFLTSVFLLEQEVRILALKSKSDKANRVALEKALEKQVELTQVLDATNQAIENQITLRFKVLEKADQLLNSSNKFAGVQYQIASQLTIINGLNRQILAVQGRSNEALATRVELYDKVLEAANPLFEIEKKLLEVAKEQNDVLTDRAELYKAIRDLNNELADNSDASVAEEINRQLDSTSSPLRDMQKLADGSGRTLAQVYANQSEAVDLYIQRVKDGIATTDLFGDRVQLLLETSRSYAAEADVFDEKYKDILREQSKNSSRNFEDAFNLDGTINNLEKAKESYQNFKKSQEDLFAAGQIDRGGLLAGYDKAAEMLDRIERGISNNEQQIFLKLDISGRAEFEGMMERLRGYVQNISDDVKSMISSVNGADFEKVAGGGYVEGLSQNTSEINLNTAAMKVLNETMFSLVREVVAGSGRDIRGLYDLVPNILNPVRRAKGGKIPGFGGGDTVPALLERGEYIIPKEMVQKYGTTLFDNLRTGNAPQYANGGSVIALAQAARKNATIQAVSEDQRVAIDLKIAIGNAEDVGRSSRLISDALDLNTKATKEIAKSSSQAQTISQKDVPAADVFKIFSDNVGKIRKSIDAQVLYFSESFTNGFLTVFEGFESLIFKMTDLFVPEFALANAEVQKQFEDTAKEINRTFEETTANLTIALQRNESTYYGYLNGIADAEKERANARLEAEKQYRESLTKSSEVFSTTLSSFGGLASGGLGLGDGASKLASAISGIPDDKSTFDKLASISDNSKANFDIFNNLLINGAASFIDTAISGLSTFFTSVVSYADNDLFNKTFKFIDKFVKDLPEAAPKFVDNLVKNADKLLNKIAQSAPVVIKTLSEQLPRVINGLVASLSETLPTIIKSITEELPTIVGALADGVFSLIPVLISTLPDILKGVVGSILTAVTSLIENLPAIIESSIQALIAALPAVVAAIIEQLPSLIATLLVASVRLIIFSLPKAIVLGLKQLFESLIDAIKNFFSNFADTFTSPFKSAYKSVTGFLGGIFHDGGVVGKEVTDTIGATRKANEVLILAQRGEGVLTSQGLAALGGSKVLEKLNQGINPYVSAFNTERTYHQGGVVGSQRGFISGTSQNRSSSYNSNVSIGSVVVPMNGTENRQQVQQRAAEFATALDKELARMQRDRRSEFGKTL